MGQGAGRGASLGGEAGLGREASLGEAGLGREAGLGEAGLGREAGLGKAGLGEAGLGREATLLRGFAVLPTCVRCCVCVW